MSSAQTRSGRVQKKSVRNQTDGHWFAARSAMATCLYCGNERFIPWYDNIQDRLGYVPGRWSFARCTDCGSALLLPQPKPADLAGFYPEVYSFDPNSAGKSRLQRLLAWLEFRLFFRVVYAAQARRALEGIHWQGQRGLRLLDVGCGRGWRLLAFRRLGFEVFGMDFQASVVDYVKRTLGIPAVSTDMAGLKRAFEPSSFDVITAFCVLEHVPDVVDAMRTCRTLLKPGGTFVAVVPLLDSQQAKCFGKRWVNVTEAPRHLSLPTSQGMMRAFQTAGYDKVSRQSDATIFAAAAAGLSLFPSANATQLYGHGSMRTIVSRLLAAASAAAAIPLSWWENHVLRQPAHGMFLARVAQ